MTKISEMPVANPLDGTEEVPILQGGANKKAPLRTYKVYTALLTQTGTDAPVATVLENTLGGTLVWSYDSTGTYIGTLASAFPDVNKVFVGDRFIRIDSTTTDWLEVLRIDSDSISLTTRSAFTLTNGILTNTTIEIRVYP